jgi:hypothetical protein
LHEFTCGSDGATPVGNLVLNANENVYGTTNAAGGGQASVFELGRGSKWKLGPLYGSCDGGEYWHSFEERTPVGVTRPAAYQGVKPPGTWAGQFPIIAWPITHAILSKYLQWQFPKALYDLRYRLVGLEEQSPETVGRLLAANVWEASSRFREFLQQEALTGRICPGTPH